MTGDRPGLPARLERVSTSAIYYDDGDPTPYVVVYVCPDPELTGEPVDEANLRVLNGMDESWVVRFRHWTWARYVVVLLPIGEAAKVRSSLEAYPVLDEHVLGEVELELRGDEDES